LALELGPEVLDDGCVGQRTEMLRLHPPVHHPLLHHVDRRPEHGVVEGDTAPRGGGHEQVEHERVEDALRHADVAVGGEGGAGLGCRVQHGAVLPMRLLAPRLDGAAPEFGEEPIEVEADRLLVAIGHQGGDRGLA
jgi:hypothetical protein